MFDERGPTDRQGGAQLSGPGAQAPLPPARTSRAAVASLVCGILGFVTCGLGGVAGLILGIVAMVKISDNPLKRKGRGLAVAGTCVSAVSLLAGLFVVGPAVILMPALGGARTEARKAACMSNMRQVGLGVLMYANDNEDVLPENLADVVNQGYGTPGILVCPADTAPMWIGTGYRCSYYYLGEMSINEVLRVAGAGRLIIAYENAANHKWGRNALFLDGHIESLDESEFKEAMRYGLEMVKAMDSWPDLSHTRRAEIEAFYRPDQAR